MEIMARWKTLLMDRVKRSHGLSVCYRKCGGFALSVLKLFVRPDPKLILFNSFGGKKFDDSPRAIYLKMKEDTRFRDYRLVWAFHEPEDYPEVKNRIRTDTLSYFVTALKARCWISNSSIQRGIVFKGKKTFSFNTWHGTPLKFMGNYSERGQVNKVMDACDVILAQSDYEADVFSEEWNISRQKYKIFGLPRNDILAASTEEDKYRLREKLGIPRDNLVILYAPTFRGYQLDKNKRCTMRVPLDYAYWKELFGDRLTFLFRMHYEVASHNRLPEDASWVDASSYPLLEDLMIASDLLISDYSSIIFDYSILDRPILNFLYDFKEYARRRGLLFDIRKELSWTNDSRELADMVKNLDVQAGKRKVEAFRAKYVQAYGHATQKSVDYLFDILHPKK